MSKVGVFIFGSCVARDTFEHLDPDEFELVHYVARQSALSAYTRAVDLVSPPVLESAFQQRMVTGDFASSLRTDIASFAGTTDLVLVDLADERLGVYILPDGSVVTRSVELIESGAEALLPAGTHHVPFGTEQHFRYWTAAIAAVGELIHRHMPRAAVALLDIPWAQRSTSGGPSPDSFGAKPHEMNAAMRPYVQAAARALRASVFTLSAERVTSSPEHRWGDAPFHYSEDVYAEIVRQLTGRPGRSLAAPSTVKAPAQITSRPAASASIVTFSADTELPVLTEQTKVVVAQHGALANGEKNLIQLAPRSERAREVVYALAQQGFHLYRSDGAESRFVLDSHVPEFWHRVKNGELQHGPEGLIYTVEPTRNDLTPMGLVVVFSSMSDVHGKSSLARMMEPNYRSLPKYVPDATIVLRIADLDAVVGGFYLDTHRHPDRTTRVAELIERVAEENGIPHSRVVVYGASKGGTAALYYGLAHGWSTLSVDPVLDDAHYETVYRDTHWTAGPLFTQRKRDRFLRTAADFRPDGRPGAQLTIVTSPRSPQYQYIVPVARQIPAESLQFVRTHHPLISDHPHVSARTIPVQAATITSYLVGSRPTAGDRDIDGAPSTG